MLIGDLGAVIGRWFCVLRKIKRSQSAWRKVSEEVVEDQPEGLHSPSRPLLSPDRHVRLSMVVRATAAVQYRKARAARTHEAVMNGYHR